MHENDMLGSRPYGARLQALRWQVTYRTAIDFVQKLAKASTACELCLQYHFPANQPCRPAFHSCAEGIPNLNFGIHELNFRIKMHM